MCIRDRAQDEDIQDVREMINNTKVMQRSDLPFIGITQEEALYYFNGEKSIEETAAAIRNKICLLYTSRCV